MKIRILKVPYDSGHRCERMARGPGYVLASHILDDFAPLVEPIESTLAFTPEVQTAFDLARQVAERVRAIRTAGDFPLLLSGNCSGSLGMIAGLEPRDTGILWFDAHGEFNTPETTRSGFVDGMPLAIATGRCWRRMAESIPGWTPLPEENIILVGVRDCDPEEQAALDGSGVTLVAAPDLNRNAEAALGPALRRLAKRVRHLYIHFDLDALDPTEATSNQWVPPAGLHTSALLAALEMAGARFPIAGAGLASLDPACDDDGRALAAARQALTAVLNTVLRNASR